MSSCLPLLTCQAYARDILVAVKKLLRPGHQTTLLISHTPQRTFRDGNAVNGNAHTPQGLLIATPCDACCTLCVLILQSMAENVDRYPYDGCAHIDCGQ
jgi:hypothetical protein